MLGYNPSSGARTDLVAARARRVLQQRRLELHVAGDAVDDEELRRLLVADDAVEHAPVRNLHKKSGFETVAHSYSFTTETISCGS